MTIKPEERVEIKIGMWLKTNGCPFFLNRNSKNLINSIGNYNLFKTKGSAKKPDLVFYDSINKEWNAVELKVGEHGINIRKGSKIIEYYSDYVKNITKYLINKKEIKISNFLVGSFYSTFGKLIKDDQLNITPKKEGGLFAVKCKIIPPIEFRETAFFVRSLWVEWNKGNKIPGVGLGILLSDALNFNTKEEQSSTGHPAIFTQKNYKNRWNQKWIIIK